MYELKNQVNKMIAKKNYESRLKHIQKVDVFEKK